jgi:hypothetical protein
VDANASTGMAALFKRACNCINRNGCFVSTWMQLHQQEWLFCLNVDANASTGMAALFKRACNCINRNGCFVSTWMQMHQQEWLFCFNVHATASTGMAVLFKRGCNCTDVLPGSVQFTAYQSNIQCSVLNYKPFIQFIKQ